MFLETKRLYLRDFTLQDVDVLYEIAYDPQVLKYCPDLLERDVTKEQVAQFIEKFRKIEETRDTESWRMYAIVSKETGEVLGGLTFSKHDLHHEYELGWMMLGRHTKKGYASEAAGAFAEYFCETYGVDYLIVVMDVDNPASFRTAEKSGFRLFEKRTVYAYNRYCDDYYYFRRYYSKSMLEHKFYDDQVYTGRGAVEGDQ